jgi:lipopolysaccharide exporter
VIPGAPAHLRAVSGWALATVLVTLGAALLRTLVVARWLDPQAIGLMAIALLVLGLMEAVGSTGVDTALVARRQDVEPFLDAAFAIQVVRGAAVFLILWAGAPFVARLFETEAAVAVIRAVGVVAVLRGLGNPATALVVRALDFRRVFWWSLPEQLISVALTIALAIARRDVWALVLGVIAGQTVGTLASYGLVRRRPGLDFSSDRLRDLLRFGSRVSGARALSYLSVTLDGAVVGTTMGVHALGLYQFAVRVAELPVTTFTRATAQVALPALSSQQTSADALVRTWQGLVRPVLWVNAAAALGIVLFAGPAVSLIVGERWLPSVVPMQILAAAMLCRGLVILAGQLFDAVGSPGSTLWLNAVRLVVLLASLQVFTHAGGLPGAALAVLVANASGAVLAWHWSQRLIQARSPHLTDPPPRT